MDRLTPSEKRKLRQYCIKWGIAFNEIDTSKTYDSNLSRLQKKALMSCQSDDTREITHLAKEYEKYVKKHFLLYYQSFRPGPKKPVQTDTSKLWFSLKTRAPTGYHGFSLRDYCIAKRLSAGRPKDQKTKGGVFST